MKKEKNNFIKSHYLLVIFLLFYFLLISLKIIFLKTPFYDWDESIYAQVGREMIRSKSFLVPLWQGTPWLDKPPVPSLFYGLVQLIPIAPEISTRLATLILSCITLLFLYLLGYRVSKQKIIALLTVIITAFLPVFFQRSTALNVDVFLLLGWLGYILWYEHFALSTFFLLLAVLSKSLLGLFPPFMFLVFHTYCLVIKQIDKKHYISYLKKIAIQLGIASIWFMGMMIVYGYLFIQYQFIDSHFKRVTASIEQHFGQRTFYIDVLVNQFKWLLIPAFGSLLYFAFQFFKKKTDKLIILLSVFFVPWFIFLNLTKTKIEWYIYPVLPQFAFLSVYPLIFLRKKPILLITGALCILLLFLLTITPISTLLMNSFSKVEDHQLIALEAKKNNCKELYVLVGDSTRTSYATLKSMDLVISTTTWWGNHPSIAYYADTRTTNLYTTNEAVNKIKKTKQGECLILEKNDKQTIPVHLMSTVSENSTYLLLQAQ